MKFEIVDRFAGTLAQMERLLDDPSLHDWLAKAMPGIERIEPLERVDEGERARSAAEQCRARGIGCLRIRPVLANSQSLACRGVRQRLPSARRCDGRFSGGRSRGGPNAPLHDRDAPKPAASKNLADPARFGGACYPA
jgi:hypothetical protein